MKIFRFMHAAYQTIPQELLIIKQKSVFQNSENWPENFQKSVI